MIEFNCPACGKVLKTPDDKAGAQAPCPQCGQTVTVPGGVFENTAPPVAAVGKKNCPECSEPIPADAVVCQYCGASVQGAAARVKSGAALTPHRGVLILVLGIVAITGICCFTGPIAWILGNQDLDEISAGRMDPEGKSMTTIGKYLGMAGSILAMCVPLIYIVIFFVAIVIGIAQN